jgi:hypothetical protein
VVPVNAAVERNAAQVYREGIVAAYESALVLLEQARFRDAVTGQKSFSEARYRRLVHAELDAWHASLEKGP